MNDWAYTFDPVSKKAWIEQIEKDLRGKPLDYLLDEWWPGEPMQPLLHQEDAATSIVRLPDHLFKSPPRITELIKISKYAASEVNDQLLEALKFGAENIIIQCDSLNDLPLEAWLKDVHLEMVSIQLEPSNFSVDNVRSIRNYLPKGVKVRINRNADRSVELDKIITSIVASEISPETVCFVYNFPSTGAWNDTTAQTLNLLLTDLSQWDAAGLDQLKFFNQTSLKLEGDPSYFKQIVQTRVLHLVWQNLIASKNLDSKISNDTYLECHIHDAEDKNPDQYLIRASMSGLAASLVGTPVLCIHHLSMLANEDFYKRSNRNIHHLLHLESNMYQQTDPLAGAYTIDNYTMQWTEKIWAALNIEK